MAHRDARPDAQTVNTVGTKRRGREAAAVFGLCLVLGFGLLWTLTAQGSPIRNDEEVLFFPSLGYRTASGAWELEVSASVFEREPRRALLAVFRKTLGLSGVSMSPLEQELFNQRAQPFLRDNQRGKEIAIRLGARLHRLGTTGANGRLTARVTLAESELRALRTPGVDDDAIVRFIAGLRTTDRRTFPGEVHLLDPEGLSVVSDIDDTIKISQVTDHQALLQNTFLKPFRAVPGMALLYQHWSVGRGARFHYVSASPWQLYEPLAGLIRMNGFPAGTFHLKEFRWKDQSFFSLLASPEAFKRGAIKPLLEQFPRRRFVLVGDSGERDPEIYGQLARDHPGQIVRIFIRETGSPELNAARYQTAFAGLPPGTGKVFHDPQEIERNIP